MLKVDDSAEFNQTREHDHRTGSTCWCGINKAVEQVIDDLSKEDLARPVPDFVKQQNERFANIGRRAADVYTPYGDTELSAMTPQALHAVIRNLETELINAKDEVAVSKGRIMGFKRILSSFAGLIDQTRNESGTISSKHTHPRLCGDCGNAGAFGPCVLLAGHEGPCRSGYPKAA